MLLIWDIHITWWKKDKIIDVISEYILWSSDTSVLFLWDYVYHFNYDRKALMALFDLFVSCFEQGKDVYILAWNHDRIWWHFVYQEAQKAFSYVSSWDWRLLFITEPVLLPIQWQDCLFFPYHIPAKDIVISDRYNELSESSHQKEQRSARANSLLWTMIDNRKAKNNWNLWVFHHRYMIWTAFPGQFSKFSFKNPWLSDHFFDEENIMLCSWHLHQAFSYKNYICLWSVWHTSPLEINQTKYLFSLDTKTQLVSATPVFINPYYHIEATDGSVLWVQEIEQHIQAITAQSHEHLFSWMLSVEIVDWTTTPTLEMSTVTLLAEIKYDQVDDYVHEDVLRRLSDFRIKQSKRQLPEILDFLDTESKELWFRISDRKSLLVSYISQKYWEESDRYIKQLEDVWISL